jgi:predicted transcriptional regulator
MPIKKNNLFEEELCTIASLAHKMSHPARLEILRFIAQNPRCMTGEICGALPLSRTTVTQHLVELKNEKLIFASANGVKVNYVINQERVDYLKDIITNYIEEVTQYNKASAAS